MKKTKTDQSIDIIKNIEETVTGTETVLTPEETISLENSLTAIKVELQRIKNHEVEIQKNIDNVKTILSNGQERHKNS